MYQIGCTAPPVAEAPTRMTTPGSGLMNDNQRHKHDRTVHLCVSSAVLIATLVCTRATAEVTHVWSAAYGDSLRGDVGLCVSTDPSGNLYLAGTFRGTVDFGGGPLTSDGTLGWGDAFLAKFDAAGNHLWSRSAGGPRQDYAHAGLADPDGNVIMVALLWGTHDVGGGPIGADRNNNVILAKYDPDGGHIWSRSFGDPTPLETIRVSGTAMDLPGNTFLAGDFNGNAYLGGDTLNSDDGPLFLARYDTDGVNLWSVQFGGDVSEIWGVDVEGNGTAFVTGRRPAGFSLLKFDTAGSQIWSVSFTATSGVAYAVAVPDGRGNVYVTGEFTGAIDFGGGPLISDTAGSAFVAKFDERGKYIWGRAWSSSGDARVSGRRACVDVSGNVIVAGAMVGDVDFGGGLLTGAGEYDSFLLELSPGGSHIWSRRFGGSGQDYPTDIHLDARGRYFITGAFENTADFGGTPLVSAGREDMFVARYDIVVIEFFDAHSVPGTIHLYSAFAADLGVDTVSVYRAEGSDSLSLYRRVPHTGGAFHFEDRHFVQGRSYRYRIGVRTGYGETLSPIRTVDTPRYATTLFPAAPNPFNPFTTIRYQMAQTGPVTLYIYDVRGRRIATLVDDIRSAGPHSVRWNGTNAAGAGVGSGVYFCRLESQDGILTGRLVLLK